MRCVAISLREAMISEHLDQNISKKKSRAQSPALKIVSTLFPRNIGFDLD
jgi:hypothetical protein